MHCIVVLRRQALGTTIDHHQDLASPTGVVHRRYQAPTHGQLVDPGLGYGLASGRRPQPGCDRLAVVIDPLGIIRMIIHRPLPNIETALSELEIAFDRLQGNLAPAPPPAEPRGWIETSEQSDRQEGKKRRPAYFRKDQLNLN